MKTPDSRFYCPLITAGTITLDENESSHAVRVCRACVGDTLQLSDGAGHFADAIIEVADAKACVVRVDTVIEAANPRPRASLGIACLKDDALEEVVFHAAQTEIDKIIFLRTDFSQEPKNSDLKKTVRRAELKSRPDSRPLAISTRASATINQIITSNWIFRRGCVRADEVDMKKIW